MSQSPAPSSTPTRRGWRGLSFQARLTLGVMLIAGLAVAVLGHFTFSRQADTTRFVTTLLSEEDQRQAEAELLNLVTGEASNADQFFSRVTREISLVADNAAALLAQKPTLSSGAYWDAQSELARLSENQWGNSPNDPASVLAPASVSLTEEMAANLNTLIHLNLLGPAVLQSNPDLLALYFVGVDGPVIYYPNIDLANVTGDFDARQRPYFQAFVGPSAQTTPYWSAPYLDAALNGLVETNSVPVYDQQGQFRGVVAADLLMTTLTDRVAGVNLAETGYAFLVDSNGRFVSLPESGWTDFGIETENLSVADLNEFSLLDTASDIRAIAEPMLAGETGIGVFNRRGEVHYLAYAPIPSTGYSLGVVVPVTEMVQLSLTISDRLDEEARSALQLTIGIVVLVLLVALLFSYLIGRLLTAPLVQLTEAAEEVAAGNLNVDVEINEGGDIGRLALAFNEMTGQLQDLVGNLEGRIAERTRAIETSMEVSRSLSTVLDQQQLLTQMVEQVQAAFAYYHVHIYVLDQASGTLNLASGTGEAGYAMMLSKHRIGIGQGLVGQAAARGKLLLIPDVTQTPDWLPNPLLPETKSEAAVPIMVGDEVLGVLDVQHNVVAGISNLDADLLQSIASQVGVAMRNARLFEQADQRANREAIVNQIGQEIQFAPDIESVLQIAARQIGEKLGVQRASVQLLLGKEAEGSNGRYSLPNSAPEATSEGR